MSTHSYSLLWTHLIWESSNADVRRGIRDVCEEIWFGVAVGEKPLKWLDPSRGAQVSLWFVATPI